MKCLSTQLGPTLSQYHTTEPQMLIGKGKERKSKKRGQKN